MNKTYYVTIKLVVETELETEEAQMALDSDLDYEFFPPDYVKIVDTEYLETATRRPL